MCPMCQGLPAKMIWTLSGHCNPPKKCAWKYQMWIVETGENVWLLLTGNITIKLGHIKWCKKNMQWITTNPDCSVDSPDIPVHCNLRCSACLSPHSAHQQQTLLLFFPSRIHCPRTQSPTFLCSVAGLYGCKHNVVLVCQAQSSPEEYGL